MTVPATVAGVTDRCGVEQGQRVEPALAEDVVVVGGAAALVGVRCRLAVPSSSARVASMSPISDGAADHSRAIAPARCGAAIDVPLIRAVRAAGQAGADVDAGGARCSA